MSQNLSMQARGGSVNGTKRNLSLRIPFSIVTPAVLSILLVSAGQANPTLLHSWDFLGTTRSESPQKSDRSSDGGYDFRVGSVLSLPGGTSPTGDPDIRLISNWTPTQEALLVIDPANFNCFLPDVDPGTHPIIRFDPAVPGGTVPEPSTLLLGLAGMLGALGIGRRRGE